MAEAELHTFTSIMDALVRISSNMKSMEQELHCPVCDEMVKQPILLPCQHSVCLLCAAEVLVQRGYPPPDLPPEPNSPASTPNTRSPRQARRPTPRTPDRLERVLRTVCGTYPGRRRKDTALPPMFFPCPSCQEDVELGEKGLTDCLRNLTLERIVERYRHTVSLGSVAIMCGFCKPPQSLEATKGCADCKSNFCNECFKLYHPWGTPRAQHEHILPTNNFRPKVLTCTEHEQERLQWYCRNCQRLLCSLCKLRRVHHGHKVLPIAQAYQALKDKVTKEVNFILANQETIQSQITELEAAIKQMEANSAVALHQLTHCIRELGAAVAERQGALALALEASRSRREEALSAQVSERRGLLEHAGLMAYTQELLKETDAPCFVQAARVTHNRLVKAIENLQCFTLSAETSFRHFHLDASKEIKLIHDLEFIRGRLLCFLCYELCKSESKLLTRPKLGTSLLNSRDGQEELQPHGAASGPPNAATAWQRLDEVRGTSAVVDRLQMDSVYVLRAADRTLTSCHLTSDLLVADLAVTQGRHYWACSVEPGSYLVKVRKMPFGRCDPDSGHDSGAEDGQDSPPFCFLTMGMGKILLPQGHGHSQSQGDSHSQGGLHSHNSSHSNLPHPHTTPLPPRLGVCLDCDKGRVTFYDAHSLRILWEGHLDCSVPVCPAFCFIGGGALQLQDLVANQSIEEPPPRRKRVSQQQVHYVSTLTCLITDVMAAPLHITADVIHTETHTTTPTFQLSELLCKFQLWSTEKKAVKLSNKMDLRRFAELSTYHFTRCSYSEERPSRGRRKMRKRRKEGGEGEQNNLGD
ncbi:Tripartite motif-containing protein 46 [Collichthys lucidus]|uniref:Tripartite motif-containing protein 46 n=1 Tax=Collichthys lucidus TaxID=240159 RepID=A0A4U5V4C3_COLLU|nr:Tripartite motif-containing protein 46 [Collichthys lucidus]